MIEWDISKLTKIIRNEMRKRFHFNKRSSCWGINIDARFQEDGSDKLFVVNVFPDSRGIDGLAEYIHKEIASGYVFSDDGDLSFIGNQREFPKYKDRLEYVKTAESKKAQVSGRSIFYRVKEPLLNLNRESLRDTLCKYTIAPLINWVQKRSLK